MNNELIHTKRVKRIFRATHTLSKKKQGGQINYDERTLSVSETVREAGLY